MVKKIPLNKNKFALVDDDDFAKISKFTWFLTNGYPTAKIKGHAFSMHRFINKTPVNMVTDHISGDTLDNRKENLRTCSHRENCRNSKKRTGSRSQYKGVSWHKGNDKWQAQIRFNYKYIHLGYFASEIDAAKAYNPAAIKYFGEFARLNKAVV